MRSDRPHAKETSMPALPAARLSPFVTERELPFWQDILPLGERRFWQVHMPVFCPGEKSGGMHLVLSGSFRAVAFSRSGQQRTLWIMRAHSLIGEVSLLTDSAAIYLMECEDEGETVFFPRATLREKILPAHPEVGLSIMRILALKLRVQSEDSQAWNFMSARKRVGDFLLHRSGETGGPVRISHAELAEFLGLHRVTVTKAVTRLREAGLIECGEEGMIIRDPDRLEQEVRSAP